MVGIRSVCAAGVLCLTTATPTAAQLLLNDTNFADAAWDRVSQSSSAEVLVSSVREASGGSDGGTFRLFEAQMPVSGGFEFGNVAHLYTLESYDPAASGAIASVDVAFERNLLLLPSPGFAADALPALRQAGQIYSGSEPSCLASATHSGSPWRSSIFAGLTADCFESPGGPPDFSSTGPPIEFGFQTFALEFMPASSTTTQIGVDEWAATIHPDVSAPAVPAEGLVALAFASAGIGQRLLASRRSAHGQAPTSSR